MNITFTPLEDNIRTKCLLLVGGAGDTSKIFQPLADSLSAKLPQYVICTFSLSQRSEVGNSLLDLQAVELNDVMSQLQSMHHFAEFALLATSMGAYPTIKLLLHPQLSAPIKRVIFLDPADYYLSDTFNDLQNEVTWSGYQDYLPNRSVISDELSKYVGSSQIDVVHLTLRNHSVDGYIYEDFGKRGIDVEGAHPRLNTQMVKRFYENTPIANRGKYVEVNNLPHGFFRDGVQSTNLHKVTQIIFEILGQPDTTN